MITDLHQKGIRVGLQINPKDGFFPHEEKYEEIKKFLEYDKEGIIQIDPLNPKILDALLKYGLEPLEDLGVDFFWNDYKDINSVHKLWVLNHFMFNDLARNPAKRGMILSRNSLKSAHKLPVHYAGESKVSWENFKSTPFFNLSASNIGACWWSHDVGGYKEGIEDPELYIRSVQLGVFSPILRFHSASGRYYKREPWKWDSRTLTIVSKYLQLRHRLMSYLYTEAYKYHKTGSMIFQPLYYYLPKVYDDSQYRIEYFFGSELLVAPIINKKNEVMDRTIHRFYLPDGVWYEFTTGKRYPGNKKYISFYKEEDYPIFAKKGSIIPLSNKSNVNNTSNPTDIEIHVFPGENNTYRLYEDDGISSLYDEGYYLITEIDYNYLQNNYTLIIRSIEGKTGIVPEKRNYKIRFRNTKYAEDVIVYFDSNQIEVSNKYVDDNDFIVEIENVSTVGQLTINCKGKDIEIDAVHVVNEDVDEILSDLQIETTLKEKIAEILFNDEYSYREKRMLIMKLKKYNLDKSFINLFKKILEYIQDI
jgi:alpha-glucosidase (family GH31 glycosyl hydrolase)